VLQNYECVLHSSDLGSNPRHSRKLHLQAEEEPKIDPKYEKNATDAGLGHVSSLKLQPIRVSHLCLRSAYLHRGNALSALGRDDDARGSYKKVLPMLAKEPRCGRLDWERSSIYVNVGNTFSRQGNFDKANAEFDTAEKLGKDHLDAESGNKVEGMGIMIVAMRARAFALKKAGKDDEAKKRMKEVIELQLKLNLATDEQKAKQKVQEAAAMAAAADGAEPALVTP
jgi:tetratricopeptide (TPR) repeat protein